MCSGHLLGERPAFRLTEEIVDGYARGERDGTLWVAGFGVRCCRFLESRGAGARGFGTDRSRRRLSSIKQARHGPPRRARPQASATEHDGRIQRNACPDHRLIAAVPGQTQWLYLIDTKTRAFALYRIDPTNSKGIVKLEASRQYEWDLKLEHYNNQPPEPDAIKATVQTLSRSTQ